MLYINPKTYGAKGDGKTDDTAAIQAAINEGAKNGIPVFFDAGVYMTGTLKMHPHTSLCAEPVWKYRGDQLGAIIRLNDPAAKCHIDLNDAFGATLNGLILDGGHLGEGIHGLMLDHPEFSKEEETYRFERCKIMYYSGNGVHLNRIWVYSMRFCMVFANKGHGIYTYGWDCFLTDNWLSGNSGAGYYTDQTTDKMIFTANRIEWNRLGGLVYKHGDMLNITGNCFDHNFGPGMMLDGSSNIGWENSGITITGNIFERNGAADEHTDPYYDSQIYLKNQKGIAMVGNVFRTGKDDNQQGRVKPSYGIVYGDISHSVIANNAMHKGAAKELIVNLGNDTEVVCQNNPGTLYS